MTKVLPEPEDSIAGPCTNALFPHHGCTNRARQNRGTLLATVALALAGCASPPGERPALTSVEPPYGPLVGGTKITIHGDNFDPSARVLVDGREAPLAFARTSSEIDVVIPPGDEPGDAELVVLAAHGTAIEPHLFHYSAPPTITAASPARVPFDAPGTSVTLEGTGFLDDGAGEATVLVDGVPAPEVTVISDTQLSFIAPAGPAFVRPTLAVVNQRGSGEKARAFRYAPPSGGLLMFSRFGVAFATFFDPTTGTSFAIPRVPGGAGQFTTVVADERGDLWGVDRSRRLGRIDFRTQNLVDPITIPQLFPALVRAGTRWFGLERIQRRFGSFDPISGTFTSLSAAPLPCCGSYGIAFDGTQLWFTARSQTPAGISLTPVSMTGELGTPVAIQDGATLHFEELRFYNGVLYATDAAETLRAIDPATGATTVMPVSPGRCNAMEVVE